MEKSLPNEWFTLESLIIYISTLQYGHFISPSFQAHDKPFWHLSEPFHIWWDATAQAIKGKKYRWAKLKESFLNNQRKHWEIYFGIICLSYLRIHPVSALWHIFILVQLRVVTSMKKQDCNWNGCLVSHSLPSLVRFCCCIFLLMDFSGSLKWKVHGCFVILLYLLIES